MNFYQLFHVMNENQRFDTLNQVNNSFQNIDNQQPQNLDPNHEISSDVNRERYLASLVPYARRLEQAMHSNDRNEMGFIQYISVIDRNPNIHKEVIEYAERIKTNSDKKRFT